MLPCDGQSSPANLLGEEGLGGISSHCPSPQHGRRSDEGVRVLLLLGPGVQAHASLLQHHPVTGSLLCRVMVLSRPDRRLPSSPDSGSTLVYSRRGGVGVTICQNEVVELEFTTIL